MALINCPQCNHTVSDKSYKCINCGYKIKKTKSKKIIIVSLCTILAITIVSFIASFITSQVNIKQYFYLLSTKNFSCVMGKHNWKDATCDTPKYCTICNSKKGKSIDHLWKEADCINPKVCLYCKKTEGAPLGHTVNIGYCDICNKYVNRYDVEFTVIEESISCLTKSYGNIKKYFNIRASASIELYYCSLAQTEALNIKEAAGIAKDMCGDIREFAKLKQCFIKIEDSLDESIGMSLNFDNYISYAEMLSEKLTTSVEAYNEAITVIKEIKKG